MAAHLFSAGVGRLHAVVDARNAASIALVERLGFTRTATRRSEDVIGGVRGFDHDYVRRGSEGRRCGCAETRGMSDKPAPASHDGANPENLLRFMMTGWATAPGSPASRPRASSVSPRGATALSQAFPGETLVVPTGHEKVRANDTNHRFRPGTDFYYLTGNHEPDNVLVLEPRGAGARRDAVLRAESRQVRFHVLHGPRERRAVGRAAPRAPANRAALRDRDQTVERVCRRLAASVTRAPFRALRGVDPALDAALPAQAERDAEFATFLSEMRLIKDELEIREMRRAVEATHHAFDDVVRALPRRAHRARDRRRVQFARARRGQRRRLHDDRGDGAERDHAALDAQRPHDRRERAAAARRRRGGGDALHRGHHAHAADLGDVHAGAARDLRARARRAKRRVRAVQARQRLPGSPPRGDARARARARGARHPRVGRRGAARREPVLQALLAPQRQPHARPRRARLRGGARREL